MVWRVIVTMLGWGSLLAPAQADEQPPTSTEVATHVVLIGGFDSDPTLAQRAGTAQRGEGNSGMYQLRNDLRARKLTAEYFNWNGTTAGEIARDDAPGVAAIVTHLRAAPRRRMAIVGNSWGGHTAWEACQQLSREESTFRIDLLIFLDPSSAGRPMSKRPEQLPGNVTQAVQYASRSAVVWQPWPTDPRIEHLDLANPQHGFLRPAGPPYGSLFSPKAHIGAEWDDLINADIVRRITIGPDIQKKSLNSD